jgi:hypothetical protein
MALDINKLENVQHKGQKITARCPACAEDGMDEKGEHLVIQEDGKFGCVLHPGASGKPHRQRIYALVGIKTHPSRPKYRVAVQRPEESRETISGRFGRVFLSYARARGDVESQQTGEEEHLTRTHVTSREASEASESEGQPATAVLPPARKTGRDPSDASARRQERQAFEDLLPQMLFRPPVRSMNCDDPNFKDTPDGSLIMALYCERGKMTACMLYADPAHHCFWDCELKTYVRPPQFYMLVCEKLHFDPASGFPVIDGAICPF